MADLIDQGEVIRRLCAECSNMGSFACMSCKILSTIKSIPPVNRWIPCSERLPYGCRVLATTKQGYVVDVIFIAKGSQWFRNGECFPTDTVIAWMPMPDAYEPPEKE